MSIDHRERKVLEAAGFQIADYSDFLGLSDAERQPVELRLGISRAIQEGRAARGPTQKQLAALVKKSQPRVAQIESASLDLMLLAFFAVGGRLVPELVKAAETATAGPRPQAVRSKG